MAALLHDPTRRCSQLPRTRRRLPARALVGVLGAAVALGATVPSTSHAQGTQQRQVELAAQIDAAKASNEELIVALTSLDQQVRDQTARAAEAERAFQDADRRLAEVQAEVDANQAEVDRIAADLRRQAIRRYVNVEEDDGSMRFLHAESIDEAEQRKVLGNVANGNSQELMERFRGARGRNEVLRQQAAEIRRESEAKHAEQQELLFRLMAERDTQARLQAEWERRLAALEAASDELDPNAAGIVTSQSRGTSAPAPSSNGRFIMPVSGNPGDGFGGARNHGGIDILAPVGTPIWAAQAGRVVQATTGSYNGGYGNLVVIDHAGGLQTRYAHLSTVRVSAGQSVSQSQVIGNVGMTGNTSGPHLHFEVYLNGTRQNPANYLP